MPEPARFGQQFDGTRLYHITCAAHGLSVEVILTYLAGGDSLDNADEPLRISLTCYKVLHANDDPRAAGVLAAAHATL